MEKEAAKEILLRYKEGKCSPEEMKSIELWMLDGADQGFDLTNEELLEDLICLRERMDFSNSKSSKYKLLQVIAAAASIIIIAALAVVLYPKSAPPIIIDSTKTNEQPGERDIPMLTLSDGTKIPLDKAVGAVAEESGVEIINDTDGNLVYKLSEQKSTPYNQHAFNTISTPKGKQFKIILPDGSKVWLNAASSLRFPVVFSNEVRNVELEGEAYFEVEKSTAMFKVLTGNLVVEVLGTHFNVNAYHDEKRRTVTLLEGSVNVNQGKLSKVIEPGQQASLGLIGAEEIKVTSNVDTDALTAWKDGVFQFNNTELKYIMRELQRWYDVDIDENIIPNKKFNGTISRKVKLSEVLAMIELTSNLHFEIEGRRVIMK